jgi:hypothetical protein
MPSQLPARICFPNIAAVFLFLTSICASRTGSAAGVTIVTHGYSGNVTGWVSGMANKIPAYPSFPGTNFTAYTLTFTSSGGSYFYQWTRTNGAPSATDSGEIIVKLDWSALAGGLFTTTSTFDVANAISTVLLLTNAISDLGGHALVEYPIHMIGHSRGGSLISEISRLLGTNGVWVDHLTTLDPHPLNNDGFSDFPSGVDAPVRTYQNVLFHDNYWQHMGTDFTVPNGEPVFGAYQRQLTNLSGGYSSSHSDVHLWYHGTIDGATPASDTETNLTSTERTNWWTAYENRGTNAGFLYSLIGGSNRLSDAQPVGPGFPMIRDGYNQWWDLGAGVVSNRVMLTSNNGNWPNLIKFNRTTTNPIVQGQSLSVKYYYQWAQPTNSSGTVDFYSDDDFNPFNSNQKLLAHIVVPGTTATNVFSQTLALALDATNVAPGLHALFAKITAGGKSRYLYAPELVQVVVAPQPPVLDIAKLNATQYQIGVNGLAGQIIVLQNSTNLQTWLPLATNTLTNNRWVYTNTPPVNSSRQFYRAVLSP